MGPPPFSSRLEPDNLPELRTIMEPTRDAVPQLPLTTTPASTTTGHAPDTHAGPFHGTPPGRQSQTTLPDWAAKVTELEAIAARLHLEGDERALNQVAKTAATISIMEQCSISDELLIRCLHYILTRSSKQYRQFELANIFCEYKDDGALLSAWGQAGIVKHPGQNAEADSAAVFLCSPEADSAYVAYAVSGTGGMRGESHAEQLAASVDPAFRTTRRMPTHTDTSANEASEPKPLSDEQLGRQEQTCYTQRASGAGTSV